LRRLSVIGYDPTFSATHSSGLLQDSALHKTVANGIPMPSLIEQNGDEFVHVEHQATPKSGIERVGVNFIMGRNSPIAFSAPRPGSKVDGENIDRSRLR
jgi:hypothetical protein